MSSRSWDRPDSYFINHSSSFTLIWVWQNLSMSSKDLSPSYRPSSLPPAKILKVGSVWIPAMSATLGFSAASTAITFRAMLLSFTLVARRLKTGLAVTQWLHPADNKYKWVYWYTKMIHVINQQTFYTGENPSQLQKIIAEPSKLKKESL